jgi:thymidine phosphorylase
VGEQVEPGGVLGIVHANDQAALAEATAMLRQAILVGDSPPVAEPLIGEVVAETTPPWPSGKSDAQ